MHYLSDYSRRPWRTRPGRLVDVYRRRRLLRLSAPFGAWSECVGGGSPLEQDGDGGWRYASHPVARSLGVALAPCAGARDVSGPVSATTAGNARLGAAPVSRGPAQSGPPARARARAEAQPSAGCCSYADHGAGL